MASGGMLALKGDADGSIGEFMNLVAGTDAISYWDQAGSSWTTMTHATADMNYTLKYLTDGDLAGYTLLTYYGTPMTGDANFDSKVDVSDLGILAANYGLAGGATWAMGDFNLDGRIDVSDLGILAANYGVGSGSAEDFDFIRDAKAFGLAGEEAAGDEKGMDAIPGCGTIGLLLMSGMVLAGMRLRKD
jgi:hypothetical protein